MNQDFALFRELFSRNLPAIIVLVVCLLTTLAQWRRHPSSVRWAVFAFGWLLFTDLVAILWYTVGFQWALENNQLAPEEEPLYVLGLSCMEGLGYLFFLLAINAARTPYRPPGYYDQFLDDERGDPRS